MIYISVQPDINYFHWQVELYIYNFLKVGIDNKDIHVVFLTNGTPSIQALSLRDKYKNIQFFFYEDKRSDKRYIPSVKPWGMYQHFSTNSYLESEQIFYHDSDIIFREKIDELQFISDRCYLSNTIDYIGYKYCLSKGVEQLHKMAQLVGIPISTIEDNEISSGGAQYILANINKDYWYKVYDDSNKLYWLMDNESKKWLPQDGYPIQKWCAEMWATLWNLWLFDYKTEVHSELDFCFATAPISDWNKYKILHNAGVDVNCRGMFFKGGAIDRTPYNDNFDYIDDKYCSFKYVENIQEFAKTL